MQQGRYKNIKTTPYMKTKLKREQYKHLLQYVMLQRQFLMLQSPQKDLKETCLNHYLAQIRHIFSLAVMA